MNRQIKIFLNKLWLCLLLIKTNQTISSSMGLFSLEVPKHLITTLSDLHNDTILWYYPNVQNFTSIEFLEVCQILHARFHSNKHSYIPCNLNKILYKGGKVENMSKSGESVATPWYLGSVQYPTINNAINHWKSPANRQSANFGFLQRYLCRTKYCYNKKHDKASHG